MTVVTVPHTLNVPKESKEIVDGIVELITDLKAKKSTSVVLADQLDNLSQYIDGWDQLDDELKSEYRDDLAGYLVQQIMEVLMPIKTPVTETP